MPTTTRSTPVRHALHLLLLSGVLLIPACFSSSSGDGGSGGSQVKVNATGVWVVRGVTIPPEMSLGLPGGEFVIAEGDSLLVEGADDEVEMVLKTSALGQTVCLSRECIEEALGIELTDYRNEITERSLTFSFAYDRTATGASPATFVHTTTVRVDPAGRIRGTSETSWRDSADAPTSGLGFELELIQG